MYKITIISIHAPREGSDGYELDWNAKIEISIHAPREGSDGIRAVARSPSAQFQSTLPVRGATEKLHKVV